MQAEQHSPELDGITLVGLVIETATFLRRVLGPALEEEIGVGGQSFEILVRLSRSPGQRLRLSDLAAQTGLTPSGLTRALDRLADAGLVRREACPNDRRGAFARLTEAGRLKMAAALDQHEAAIAALLDGVLSRPERSQLAGLLTRLRDRVHGDALAGAGGGGCSGAEGADQAEQTEATRAGGFGRAERAEGGGEGGGRR